MQQQVIERLRAFAGSHAFAIRVDYTTPDQQHFLIQMWREDVKVIGRNPFDPEFRISFYTNSKDAVPSDVLERLEIDLKDQLAAIAGSTISAK